MKMRLYASAAFFACLLAHGAAHADSLTPLGNLGGIATAWNLSGDGAVAGGITQVNGEIHIIIWKNGQVIDLGTPGVHNYILDISYDGSTVLGNFTDQSTFLRSSIWHNGSWTDLGIVPGFDRVTGLFLSDDGTKAVGAVVDTSTNTQSAFYWHNGTMIEAIPGAPNILVTPTNLSRDGSTFAAIVTSVGTGNALIWKNGTVTTVSQPGEQLIPLDMTSDGGKVVMSSLDLGTYTAKNGYVWDGSTLTQMTGLSGSTSTYATNISRDGTIVAGAGVDSSGTHLLRWNNNALQDLGLVTPIIGLAPLVKMSDDGNTLVYASYLSEPYKWTATGGLKTFSQVMTDANVDITGWNFADATLSLINQYGLLLSYAIVNMSYDGQYILGTGTYNGATTPYMMSSTGVITIPEVVESIQPASTGAAQSQTAMSVGFSQSIFAARQAFSTATLSASSSASRSVDLSSLTPAAGGDDDAFTSRHRWSSYMVGNLGIGQSNNFSSHAFSGSAGLIHRPNDSFAFGGGLIGSRSETDLRLDGSSRINSSGASLIAAYEPVENPFRFYASAAAAYLDLDMDRHYMNGGTVDGSSAKTHGFGYGASVQAGWKMQKDAKTSLMPYVGVEASHTRLDGYQEVGGSFPAAAADQTGEYVATSLGAEISHQLSDPLELRGRAAWGHRLTGSGGAVTATVGPITQAVPYQQGDRDWAEFGATAVYKISDNTTLMGDLSARAGETTMPAVNATVGLNIGF